MPAAVGRRQRSAAKYEVAAIADARAHSGCSTKRTTGATGGPKSLKGFCLALPVSRRQTGWLPAGLMLALRWPFGPWPQDAGLLDTGPVGHWSLSALVALALVAVGSGWCEKPLNQPAAIQRLIECTVQMKPTVPSKI